MSRVRLAVVLVLPLLLAFVGAARPAAAEKSAADLLPPSTLAYVEISDPKAVLSTTLDNPLRQQLEDSSAFRDAMDKPNAKKLKQVVKLIEDRAGVQWRPALEQISGGGIALAFEPLTQGVVVLVKPEDMKTAEAVRDALISMAEDDAKKHGKPDPVTTKAYRGLKAWHVNEAIVADLGPWVMISNKKGLAQRVADNFLDGGDALAGDEDFGAARRLAAGPGTPPSAWAFVRLAPIRLFAKSQQPWLDPASKSDNPGIEFVLGGLIPVAQNAPYATASLWAGHGGIKLAAAAPMDRAWVPAGRKFFFAAPPDGAAKPLRPPGTLLSLTTYRDVAAMWQAGPDLFTESVATQMAQTDSGLSALFGGKSFGNDVLGAFKPQMQLVVARNDFPAGGLTPTLKLPAAALVLEIRPDQFAHVRKHFRVAFQAGVALGNLNGAQQGRALLDLQTERRGDCEIQFATYSGDDDAPKEPAADKKVKKDAKSPKDDAYLNLSPAMALSNRRLILSTSRQLAEELADLDAKEQSPARIRENTLIAGNPNLAADLIKANREQLVAGNMLQKGHDRKTAEREISLLQAIAGAFSDARVRLLPEEKSIRFELEVKTVPDATADIAHEQEQKEH
ncbi:MAG TPA: hypothetical protein VGI81_10915 [Tepidisphaeraceae bacterium]|jgi:hypothetical protein